MAAHLGSVAVTAIVLVALVGGASAQTLGNSKNDKASCNPAFNLTLATKYVAVNDSACANLIYQAFSIETPSQCPPTGVGSPVHYCMNKNNTGGYADIWATLISGCEYMYIANRQGQSESETGFQYSDNSCFQRFDSWGSFNNWLRDASPYGGVGSTIAAGMTRVAFGMLAAALIVAFMMLFQ